MLKMKKESQDEGGESLIIHESSVNFMVIGLEYSGRNKNSISGIIDLLTREMLAQNHT